MKVAEKKTEQIVKIYEEKRSAGEYQAKRKLKIPFQLKYRIQQLDVSSQAMKRHLPSRLFDTESFHPSNRFLFPKQNNDLSRQKFGEPSRFDSHVQNVSTNYQVFFPTARTASDEFSMVEVESDPMSLAGLDQSPIYDGLPALQMEDLDILGPFSEEDEACSGFEDFFDGLDEN